MIGGTNKRGAGRRLSTRLFRMVGLLLVLSLALPLLVVIAYGFVNPPISALMATQALAGSSYRQHWVPLEKISPHLIKAVVLSEDIRFCAHWGVDWNAVEEAIDDADRRGDGPKGTSSIPMQTAKNLFLWQERSYVRKAIEIPLAYVMTALWPKRRMLEIYLNIAEWAPGVFGAEAAARHHFKTTAAKLSRGQAALLAAALPNPYVRHAGRAGPKTRRLAKKIERRMTREKVQLGCLEVDHTSGHDIDSFHGPRPATRASAATHSMVGLGP